MRSPLLILMVLSSSMLGMASDPFLGSWTLDMDKSSTGKIKATEPRSATFIAIPNGYSVKRKIGSGPENETTFLFDGKEHSVPQGSRLAKNTGATAVIAKRVSNNLIEIEYRRQGNIVATDREEVSGDGKVLTAISDGADVNGSKLHNVLVYVKN